MLKQKYPIKTLILIILLIVSAITFAQNRNNIDSLKNIINNKNAEDITIIHAYLNMSYEYKNTDLNSALICADSALNKSLKINYKNGIAEAYRRKGVTMTYLNNYKTADSFLKMSISAYNEINQQPGVMECYVDYAALAYYKGENRRFLEYSLKALKIAEDNNLIEDKSMILINIGIAYKEMGDYEKAIEYALDALKTFEKLGDKNMIAICCSSLGNLYIETKEYNKSLKYTNKALKLYIELKDTRKQSICYTNMGKIYLLIGKFNETLKNFNKAVELYKKNKDLRGISSNYSNIGTVYFKLNDNITAMEYYKKALKIDEQIGDKNGIASIYYNISKLETKRKNYIIAEDYCLKSIDFFKQNNALNNHQKSLDQLASIYNSAGKYQKAYNTHIEAIVIKDSLFNIKKAEKIAQLEEKYLNEKLEKQNLTLKYENEIQQSKIKHHNKSLKIYFIVLLLMLIAITIIYIQFRKKKRSNKFLVQKNIDLLNKENELKIVKEKMINNESNKNRKITICDNVKEEIHEKLIQLIDNEKIYKDFDLTIDKLAKNISTNRNYLSQTIYKEYGKSYSDFINEYRVKESMHILSNPDKNNKLSIAGIGREAGFRSIPRFIYAFKKFTGITPSGFRSESNTL